MKTNFKMSQSEDFTISAKAPVYDVGQNLKMTKTSEFCSIHQESCKSCLQSNLIILTQVQGVKEGVKNFCSVSNVDQNRIPTP